MEVHDHGSGHDGHSADEAMHEEQVQLQRVIAAFASYRKHAMGMNQRRRSDYMSLPERHKQLIPGLLEKIDLVEEKIDMNMHMLNNIIKFALQEFLPRDVMPVSIQDLKARVTSSDMDKVRSTLKQFVRDWTVQGKMERDLTYAPILNELNILYDHVPVEERGSIRILVPGAGLGRLAYDIATEGFSCQGNEFSFYMLIASYFVLNKMEQVGEYELYPFIHSFSNIRSSDEQLAPVHIPDVLPRNLLPGVDFSMVAGDFIEVYGGQADNFAAWDVVVTCFFIDTANNVLEYIEIIHKILKSGGRWINIGPLLYHFEDIPGESSVELSLEEVKRVSRDIGFDFKEERMISTTYTSNPGGMLKYVYDCAYWVAVKTTPETE